MHCFNVEAKLLLCREKAPRFVAPSGEQEFR